MSYKITTKSYYGTNEISNFNTMTPSQQAMAIQSIANTGHMVDAFERNHREMLEQNEAHQRENMALVRQQNAIQARQVEETNAMNANLVELTESTNMVGLILSQFAEQNIGLLTSINTSVLTTVKQMALLNQGVDTIIELLKVPEFEKERIFYIKEAFKYIEMAIDNPIMNADALEYLEKAFELNKRDVVVNYNIALLKQHRSVTLDTTGAKKHLELAAKYVFNDAELQSSIYAELAYNEMTRGDFKKALSLCEMAASANPKNTDAMYYALDITMMTEKYKDSFSLLFKRFDIPTALKVVGTHMCEWDYYNRKDGDKLNEMAYHFVDRSLTTVAELQMELLRHSKIELPLEKMVFSFKKRLGRKYGELEPRMMGEFVDTLRDEYAPLDEMGVVFR